VTPILILRALGLGDALTAVPALRGLRRRYGDRRLVLAGPEAVSRWFADLGLVDEVIPAAGLPRRSPGVALGPHLAVNLHGRGPQSHRLLQAADPDDLVAFDCPAIGHRTGCQWRTDEHEVARWCRLMGHHGAPCSADDLRLPVNGANDGTVIVHPGAASLARRWPAGRWGQVVADLRADGHRVVLTGTERELCHSIARATGAENLRGLLRLEELADCVASAALVLCGDTGVAHLATALGTRSVTLFGPVPPAWWGPAIDLDRHTVLYHGTTVGDPHADVVDPALLRISVSEVLSAARAQLRETTRSST
jgi:ADP-heptose:LPS heptosyltransferase